MSGSAEGHVHTSDKQGPVPHPPDGYYIDCPHCSRELRINRKYAGQDIQCKFCKGPFRFESSNPMFKTAALYADCPHCSKELRVATKYLGKTLACKFCDGKLVIGTAPS